LSFSQLVRWLWPDLIQHELDVLKDRLNAHKVRFDKKKKLPSGASPDVLYALPERFGGQDCLQPVDPHVIRKLMENIGGEDLIRFVDKAYASRAQAVFDTLHLEPVTLRNAWDVFQKMIPFMS
jgi:hypothetical protein